MRRRRCFRGLRLSTRLGRNRTRSSCFRFGLGVPGDGLGVPGHGLGVEGRVVLPRQDGVVHGAKYGLKVDHVLRQDALLHGHDRAGHDVVHVGDLVGHVVPDGHVLAVLAEHARPGGLRHAARQPGLLSLPSAAGTPTATPSKLGRGRNRWGRAGALVLVRLAHQPRLTVGNFNVGSTNPRNLRSLALT